jgi:hypothetical protein
MRFGIQWWQKQTHCAFFALNLTYCLESIKHEQMHHIKICGWCKVPIQQQWSLLVPNKAVLIFNRIIKALALFNYEFIQ